jgi:hypothetical protein
MRGQLRRPIGIAIRALARTDHDCPFGPRSPLKARLCPEGIDDQIAFMNARNAPLLLAVALAAPCLTACTPATVHLAAVGQRGEVLIGSVSRDANGGSFQAGNGYFSCFGKYDPMWSNWVISVDFVCSDGRQGFGTITRGTLMLSGTGNVSMSDGEEAQVIMGPEADNFRAAPGR